MVDTVDMKAKTMDSLDSSLFTMLQGDAEQQLKTLQDESIDLFVTSPPYAEQRKGKYNGVKTEDYVEWFCRIATEIKRTLKPKGSFFLNINSHCDEGERDLYVMELVIALKKEIGFCFVDELVWYKSASPRRKTFRLKNAWEPVFQFAKQKGNYINHKAIEVPTTAKFVNKKGWTSHDLKSGNVGGYHNVAEQGNGFTDPHNILVFPTSLAVVDEHGSKYEHPAKFPYKLPEFLVKGFCPPGGTVCDPFMGSGSTAIAALLHNMKCIGIELEPTYCELAIDRVKTFSPEKITKTSTQMRLWTPEQEQTFLSQQPDLPGDMFAELLA